MRFGRVTVGGGFVLFWLALFWWNDSMPLFWVAALVHELGHWAAIRLAGGHISAVHLTLNGAEMRTDALSYPREIVTTLAGPLTSLSLGVASSFVGQALHHEDVYFFAGVNLVLGLFNLLPARVLDGGRILCLLVSWGAGTTAADRAAFACDIVCAALLSGVGFLSFLETGSVLTLILAASFVAAIFRK